VSVKEVGLLSEVFLALVTTVASDDVALMAELQTQGGIILAIDGVQPEKGNETLYLLRDTRSGRVLVARNLLSSASAEVAGLIDEVLALKVPILGVISDKQESICLAIERRLPEVPHQLCHFHYLRDVAQPVSEADRSLKKQLKQKVRGIREVELKVAKDGSVEGQVVRDYCLALRTVMREDGKYPLEPAGIALYDQLAAIADSLRRALQQRPSPKLQRLLTILKVLERFEAEYVRLVEAWSWIHHLAHLLAHAAGRLEASAEVMSYATGLKDGVSDELREMAGHIEKLTLAFAPYLFAYLDQPLLPRTNNDLELFIGQLKKTRRQVTGRRNVSAYILREGRAVAVFLGLPTRESWLNSFARVEIAHFRERLAELRRTQERSKCWQIRRALQTFLGELEQLWQAESELQPFACLT